LNHEGTKGTKNNEKQQWTRDVVKLILSLESDTNRTTFEPRRREDREERLENDTNRTI
jgi:hypothetical protein